MTALYLVGHSFQVTFSIRTGVKIMKYVNIRVIVISSNFIVSLSTFTSNKVSLTYKDKIIKNC